MKMPEFTGVTIEDEKMSCFAGNPISVNMNIFANNEFQTDDDKEMLNIALKNHMSVGVLRRRFCRGGRGSHRRTGGGCDSPRPLAGDQVVPR